MSMRTEKIDALAKRAGQIGDDPGVSLAAAAWRRLRRNPAFITGGVLVAAFIVLAILAPFLAPHDPAVPMLGDQVIKARNQIPPSQPGHPLGGDQVGRDLLSRLLVGSQQTR